MKTRRREGACIHAGLHRALALALAAAGGSACATDVFRLEGFGAISRSMGAWRPPDVGAAGMMTNPATLSLMQPTTPPCSALDLVTTDIDVRNRAPARASIPAITAPTVALITRPR
jgi:long-chain fatty acid transport protein